MPAPDPVPPGQLKRQFVRIMGWGALFSAAIAAIAVILVAQGGGDVPIHMAIATALGVGLTVMLAIALMTLMFLSSRAHDQQAADHQPKDDHEPRT